MWPEGGWGDSRCGSEGEQCRVGPGWAMRGQTTQLDSGSCDGHGRIGEQMGSRRYLLLGPCHRILCVHRNEIPLRGSLGNHLRVIIFPSHLFAQASQHIDSIQSMQTLINILGAFMDLQHEHRYAFRMRMKGGPFTCEISHFQSLNVLGFLIRD